MVVPLVERAVATVLDNYALTLCNGEVYTQPSVFDYHNSVWLLMLLLTSADKVYDPVGEEGCRRGNLMYGGNG